MTIIETRPSQETPEPSFLDLDGRLAPGWGTRLTAAWAGVITLGILLEPAPAEGEAMSLIGTVLTIALMGSWLTMVAGFLTGRRLGAAASLAGAVTLVAFTIGCPLSGHHAGLGAVASWWYIQLAGSMALVGLSGRALRRA